MLRKQVTLQLVTYTLRRERKFYKSTGVYHLLDKNSLISALSFLHVHFPFLCKAAVTKGAGDQFFREKPCREVSSKGLHARSPPWWLLCSGDELPTEGNPFLLYPQVARSLCRVEVSRCLPGCMSGTEAGWRSQDTAV